MQGPYNTPNTPHLGADHGCTLCHAAQGLAQVAAAAHKRHREVVLVDVVDLVSGRQHLRARGVVALPVKHTTAAAAHAGHKHSTRAHL
jgi:hypothetical protein